MDIIDYPTGTKFHGFDFYCDFFTMPSKFILIYEKHIEQKTSYNGDLSKFKIIPKKYANRKYLCNCNENENSISTIWRDKWNNYFVERYNLSTYEIPFDIELKNQIIKYNLTLNIFKKNANVLNVDIENIIFLFLGFNFYINKNK